MAAKSEKLNSNSMLRLYKQNMLKFTEIKSNEPKITQKEISKQLGFSDGTIKRYRDDINMDSPYNRKNTRIKIINQILQKLKPNLIQRVKHLKLIKILKTMKRTT